MGIGTSGSNDGNVDIVSVLFGWYMDRYRFRRSRLFAWRGHDERALLFANVHLTIPLLAEKPLNGRYDKSDQQGHAP